MQQHIEHLQHNEMVQSAISYGVGGGVAGAAWLIDAGEAAQAIAFILGAIVVAIRLLHDALRFYRYWKTDKK